MPTFDIPKSGQPLTALAPVVQALARAGNGLNSLRFEPGENWAWAWEEGGAVITYPKALDSVGNGGNGDGDDDGGGNNNGALSPHVWDVIVNGQAKHATFLSSDPS